MFEKRDPETWRVQVRCDMEDCQYCQEGWCQADYISIDAWKECDFYGAEEKEKRVVSR